ncbi:Chorismate mutase [Smittium mucronatum]|uniref:Chorismate mutase n=1 Tax=Smittium mucronatum TaxID=133383 RepID=A0A1R0H3Y6_9FUNG|nr:Chorismate mutase [Smittium mucronatum]
MSLNLLKEFDIDLELLRTVLIRLEDTIIFCLAERAQFMTNDVIYQPNKMEFKDGFSGSFLDWFLQEVETVHAKVRRYNSPDEYPFTKNLPAPILSDLEYPKLLVKNEININDEIKKIYIEKVVQKISEHGDDSNYGSAATRDIECLQALSRRIHYGKFVAESKFRDPKYHDEYVRLIKEQNGPAIDKLLTNELVEKKVLERIRKKTLIYGQDFDSLTFEIVQDPNSSGLVCTDISSSANISESAKKSKIDSDVVVELYRDHVIPLTKFVEVHHKNIYKMSAKTNPSATKPKPSRKGKQNWRKNIDLSEVEQALDENRQELINSGVLIKDQKDDSLFSLDVLPDNNIKAPKKKLYIDTVLTSTSKIVVPGKQLVTKKALYDPAKSKQVQAMIKKLGSNQPKKEKRVRVEKFDIWSESAPTIPRISLNPNQNGFSDAVFLYSKKKPRVPQSSIELRKLITPAVELPDPGMSYIPREEDRQLIERAEIIASEMDKNVEDDKTVVDSDEENDEETDGDNDKDLPPKKKPTIRKTSAQRRKQDRLNKKLKTIAGRKARKLKALQIRRINKLKTELEQEMEDKENARKLKLEILQKKSLLPKTKIGKYRIKPVDAVVKLGNEVTGSLRTLETEGSLLAESFVGMQRRNLIEPRIPVT